MKRLVIFLISAVVSVGSIMAQQSASPGSSFKYSVNPSVYVTDVPTGSGFGWSITGGAPGDFVQTPGANNGEINVNWVNPGIYTISWLETSKHGCPDPALAKTYIVTVSATTIDITTADVIIYSCSSATADVINVQFSRTLTAAEFPVTGTASITINGTTTATVAFTTNNPGVASNTATITLTGFEGNSTQIDQTNNFTFNALNLKDAKGGTVAPGATKKVYNRNVWATPSTGGITVN